MLILLELIFYVALLLLIFFAIFYFVIYKLIYKTFIKSFTSITKYGKEEKKAFQQMLLSPTNDTVSKYIKVLKEIAEFSSNSIMTSSLSMADQLKYANAYQVVKGTASVSNEIKEELYRVYLILGVPLQK